MNTNSRELLLQSLLKNLMASSGDDNVFALAEYAYNTKEAVAGDTPVYSEEYQSLMQDFQDKCDEYIALEGTYQERCADYDRLQEQFTSLERAIKGMRGDYEELNNSKAALQRDYDQLVAAFSLKSSECIDLTAERDAVIQERNNFVVLAEHNDSYREILMDIGKRLDAPEGFLFADLPAMATNLLSASTNTNLNLASTITELRSKVAFLQDQLDGYHGKVKTPRPKRELKDDESPKVEEFVWVNPPEVGES